MSESSSLLSSLPSSLPSSEESESDDPPGTVTRVREPRKDRDEPTAVTGSTRLEAKKQRRREGNDRNYDGRRPPIDTSDTELPVNHEQ